MGSHRDVPAKHWAVRPAAAATWPDPPHVPGHKGESPARAHTRWGLKTEKGPGAGAALRCNPGLRAGLGCTPARRPPARREAARGGVGGGRREARPGRRKALVTLPATCPPTPITAPDPGQAPSQATNPVPGSWSPPGPQRLGSSRRPARQPATSIARDAKSPSTSPASERPVPAPTRLRPRLRPQSAAQSGQPARSATTFQKRLQARLRAGKMAEAQFKCPETQPTPARAAGRRVNGTAPSHVTRRARARTPVAPKAVRVR